MNAFAVDNKIAATMPSFKERYAAEAVREGLKRAKPEGDVVVAIEKAFAYYQGKKEVSSTVDFAKEVLAWSKKDHFYYSEKFTTHSLNARENINFAEAAAIKGLGFAANLGNSEANDVLLREGLARRANNPIINLFIDPNPANTALDCFRHVKTNEGYSGVIEELKFAATTLQTPQNFNNFLSLQKEIAETQLKVQDPAGAYKTIMALADSGAFDQSLAIKVLKQLPESFPDLEAQVTLLAKHAQNKKLEFVVEADETVAKINKYMKENGIDGFAQTRKTSGPAYVDVSVFSDSEKHLNGDFSKPDGLDPIRKLGTKVFVDAGYLPSEMKDMSPLKVMSAPVF